MDHATSLEKDLSDEQLLSRLNLDEIKRINSEPSLNEFHRNKLEREAKKNWNAFYKRNGNRFFKNRYWTRREFKELFEVSDTDEETDCQDGVRPMRYLLEVGCGCGEFALPILDADEEGAEVRKSCNVALPKDLFIYCCDISDKAIELLHGNPVYLKHSPHRIQAFVADITTPDVTNQIVANLTGQQMDFVSLVFVLSALDPRAMKVAISNVRHILKPNGDGMVLFRDYAIYDQAMVRFSEKSKICDQFYVRQDGTRAYFFSKQQLIDLFEECGGFECLTIGYVRRETVNNATKDNYSRIFLQAKFVTSEKNVPL